ncbi:cell division protein FtsQ [Geosporobacter subterraneus DSM 17957]|uniref:Cell division protein FtsQ n=1 Tax=Geosporobacter subterraneus DSM 17957 TaxID=1121919 RepID=A0A1M6GVN1_9FIRM|nr:FtsQ-type POTRA domain-containing protein [Geosporobacter subterraneus]SHJ13996.1 cell division protein FtsQ [Geosporobacter subterraneus DSM 17957]
MYINQSLIDKKRKRKKLILFVMLLCCIISFIIIFKTDFFCIKVIEIKGNVLLSQEDIVQASGITLGNQIYKEKIKDVKIGLSQHPYIKSVEVKRKLPNRISINIVEREEIAAIPFMGAYVFIDENGMILKSETHPENLKIIYGLEFDHFMEGEPLEVKDPQKLEKALEIIKSINQLGMPIKNLDVNDPKNYTIKLTDTLLCRIGEGSNIDYRLSLLVKILQDLESKDITRGVIDISYDGNPTYRPVD